jgi:chromosome segregation ATPase
LIQSHRGLLTRPALRSHAELVKFKDMEEVLQEAVKSTKYQMHHVETQLNDKMAALVEAQSRAIAASEKAVELQLELDAVCAARTAKTSEASTLRTRAEAAENSAYDMRAQVTRMVEEKVALQLEIDSARLETGRVTNQMSAFDLQAATFNEEKQRLADQVPLPSRRMEGSREVTVYLRD